jgi:hypothetical protein
MQHDQHKTVAGRPANTVPARTKRHSPVRGGTAGSMQMSCHWRSLPSSGRLSAAGAPGGPVTTGLLLSGRSRVRVAVGAHLTRRLPVLLPAQSQEEGPARSTMSSTTNWQTTWLRAEGGQRGCGSRWREHLVARAAWWSSDDGAASSLLDILDVADDPNRIDVGVRLLKRASPSCGEGQPGRPLGVLARRRDRHARARRSRKRASSEAISGSLSSSAKWPVSRMCTSASGTSRR